MPSSQQIIEQLTTAANAWQAVASLWHLLLGAFLVSLVFGWRPQKRLVGMLLVCPLVSVSLIAWWSGNPFNGVVFAALAMALVGLATRLRGDRLSVAPPRLVWPGVGLIGFGWIYPHFLETRSWYRFLYATPVGIVPCPTLATTIGISLVLWGFWIKGMGSGTRASRDLLRRSWCLQAWGHDRHRTIGRSHGPVESGCPRASDKATRPSPATVASLAPQRQAALDSR